ncbi:hypothetical protein E8E14_009980 [Neopestalotiopsis sp. 37M]|nr:hypothetical protein E8E14_009980 [Neopestalotiopsis sp. 37M]
MTNCVVNVFGSLDGVWVADPQQTQLHKQQQQLDKVEQQTVSMRFTINTKQPHGRRSFTPYRRAGPCAELAKWPVPTRGDHGRAAPGRAGLNVATRQAEVGGLVAGHHVGAAAAGVVGVGAHLEAAARETNVNVDAVPQQRDPVGRIYWD